MFMKLRRHPVLKCPSDQQMLLSPSQQIANVALIFYMVWGGVLSRLRFTENYWQYSVDAVWLAVDVSGPAPDLVSYEIRPLDFGTYGATWFWNIWSQLQHYYFFFLDPRCVYM